MRLHRLPLFLLFSCSFAAAQELRVEIDSSKAPEHAAWAVEGQKLGNEWYPRLVNLLLSPDAQPPRANVRISIDKEYKGVAYANGRGIVISANWVAKNPDDSRGVIIHELTHIVQAYPGGSEGWLVEGIADYIRWGIYEAKPLSWFPKPQKPQGYKDSYQVAGGFLLWLEAGPAPGIVRKLNHALRTRQYKPDIFEKMGGKPLDELWNDYLKAAEAAQSQPLPKTAKVFRTEGRGGGGGRFENTEGKKWVEYRGDNEVARFEETERTDRYIEIFDASRGIRLRLESGRVLLQRDGNWGRLYTGKWAE